MNPRVTIGLCVRNCENSVKEALASINQQSYPHELIELIIVDDGSTDQTCSVTENYLSRTGLNTQIFHHNWKGLGPTRNVVVNKAKGSYIVWVDGDMILPSDHVRKQVKFMTDHPEVAIAKAKYAIYETSSLPAYLENIDAFMEFLNDKQGVTSKPLGTGGSIYRVKAIRQIGGFDEKIKGAGEDMDVEMRLRQAGWSLCISQATFYEMRRTSWRALWNEYSWHGCGMKTVFQKNKRPSSALYMMFPPAAVLVKLLRSRDAYKVVFRKSVFLLPLHWLFKRMAWLSGLALKRPKGNECVAS